MPETATIPPPEELTLPVFGVIEPHRVLAQDELFAVVRDRFPVTPGHTLIIPKRAVQRLRELSSTERSWLMEWLVWAQDQLSREEGSGTPDFNVGVNDGPAAGQTMPQFHLHVIPRRPGDVPDPRGGVRWVVPERAKYW